MIEDLDQPKSREEIQHELEEILEETYTEEIRFFFDALRLGLEEQNILNKESFMNVFYHIFKKHIALSLSCMESKISIVLEKANQNQNLGGSYDPKSE